MERIIEALIVHIALYLAKKVYVHTWKYHYSDFVIGHGQR